MCLWLSKSERQGRDWDRQTNTHTQATEKEGGKGGGKKGSACPGKLPRRWIFQARDGDDFGRVCHSTLPQVQCTGLTTDYPGVKLTKRWSSPSPLLLSFSPVGAGFGLQSKRADLGLAWRYTRSRRKIASVRVTEKSQGTHRTSGRKGRGRKDPLSTQTLLVVSACEWRRLFDGCLASQQVYCWSA